MNLRNVGPALLAGFASFLVVAIAVTALLETRIEFSALLGLPAGVLAGVVVTGAVYLGLDADASRRRRRTVSSVVAFTGGFIAAMGLAVVADLSPTLSTLAVIVVGIVAVVVGYLRSP